MDKTFYMMGETKRDELILEIGPSYRPIVTKADGWNVRTVDHATRAELEAKYRNWGVDVSLVEDVDYIWQGGPLEAVIPHEFHGKFSRVLASHVIEHMPNMLGFLQSVSALLSPAGTLALAVPDKRFCFDFFRPVTMTSDVVAANMSGASRHSAKSAFESYFYAALGGKDIAWSGTPEGAIGIQHSWKGSVDAFNNFCNASTDVYIDVHASCFTPRSFELIMLELGALELCDLSVRSLYRTGGYEFFVVLDKSIGSMQDVNADTIAARRRALLDGMIEEIEEQAATMRRAEPSPGGPSAPVSATQGSESN